VVIIKRSGCDWVDLPEVMNEGRRIIYLVGQIGVTDGLVREDKSVATVMMAGRVEDWWVMQVVGKILVGAIWTVDEYCVHG
jgi:hypothetical protein